MNEQQQLLAESIGGVFKGFGTSLTVATHWKDIEALGLPGLLVPETRGGFGGNWNDALIALRLLGFHAVALPVAEAIIAAAFAPDDAPGIGTIAPVTHGDWRGDRFTGLLPSVPWARDAGHVVAQAPSGIMLLPKGDRVELGTNIAGEPRDTLHYDDVVAIPLGEGDLLALGALARTAQTAGALDAALTLTIEHANARNQFGRPLSKFQAVEQALAGFASEAAAANCAAAAACRAAAHGNADVEIAAAKLCANAAIDVGTAVAHQVHGAIGFTEEHGLHPFTRRLWAWRSEFGGDALWSARLGNHVARAGADGFWADLVHRSDSQAA